MHNAFNEIFEYVKGLTIIDSHEHLPHREDAREKDNDVIMEYLAHYFNRDLISAGLSTEDFQRIMDPDSAVKIFADTNSTVYQNSRIYGGVFTVIQPFTGFHIHKVGIKSSMVFHVIYQGIKGPQNPFITLKMGYPTPFYTYGDSTESETDGGDAGNFRLACGIHNQAIARALGI